MKSIFFPATRFKAWLHVSLLTLTIFSTLSLVRPIVTFLRQTHLLNPVVWTSLLLFLLIFFYLIRQLKITKKRGYFFLAVLIISYAVSLKYLVVAPEERIHFIEYGLLTFLIYQALSLDIQKKWLVFTATFCLASIIGYADEVVQYYLPNRYYDIRDVGLNVLSGIFMLAFIAITQKNDLQGSGLPDRRK